MFNCPLNSICPVPPLIVMPVTRKLEDATAVMICQKGLQLLAQLSTITVLSVAVQAEAKVGGAPQFALIVVDP